MTTEHMHHEHSDGDFSVAENTSVPETMTSPTPLDDAAPAEGQADTHSENLSPQHEESSPAPATAYQNEEQNQNQNPVEQPQTEEPTTTEPSMLEAGSPNEVDAAVERPFVGEAEVRPFTSFIEEFQQEQARMNVPSPELEVRAFEEIPFTAPALEAEAAVTSETSETTAAEETQEASSPAQTPSAQRPVSPLLRPASRIRGQRHHSRQREESTQTTQHIQEETPLTTATTETTADVPAVLTSTSTASAVSDETTAPAASEPEQVRPARRYRFDRPAPAASAAPSTPAQSEEQKEAARPLVSTENGHTTNGNGHAQVAERTNQQGQQSQKQIPAPAQPVETPVTKTPAVESATETGDNQAAAVPVEHERRRRHGQERQREKEQAHATPAAPSQATPTPAAESVPQTAQAAQTTEPVVVPVQPEEVSPEDLPPLEYADLQAASSRRRRRRRPTPTTNANANASTTTTSAPAAKAVTPEPTSLATPTPAPAPAPAPASPIIPSRGAGTTTSTPYNIVSGYTVGQMNQNGDGAGPFMGPEPSPARGSTPTHGTRSGRAEIQRNPAYTPLRSEPSASAASVSHLANVVAQAIQGQTDRMVAELRRANQGPTNVSVTLPPFPSTERVGVFVDVANLLYSARTMRINIDFGKLLDFLRGNRRLVRAHAYCPTSPQPGDEQMFLQAVKGLGYRITTKNYKTFSSGAKKADLDLDLCMDVVRLVDGRAVDCIVLVSGDSDFMPMLDYCSDHGVRVEVAAFDEAMSATLRQSCDLFINLSMLGEIRA